MATRPAGPTCRILVQAPSWSLHGTTGTWRAGRDPTCPPRIGPGCDSYRFKMGEMVGSAAWSCNPREDNPPFRGEKGVPKGRCCRGGTLVAGEVYGRGDTFPPRIPFPTFYPTCVVRNRGSVMWPIWSCSSSIRSICASSSWRMSSSISRVAKSLTSPASLIA